MKTHLKTTGLAAILITLASSRVLLSGGTDALPDRPALVLVESRYAGTVNDLVGANITVVREFGGGLLVVAGADDIAAIENMALAYRVIAEDVSGRTFYTALLGNDERVGIAASRVAILAREGFEVVFSASPGEAEALAAEGIELARIFLTPMRPHPPTGPVLPPSPLEAEPSIEDMVAAVSISRINTDVQRLQDFVTRYSRHDSCRAAARWVQSQFESFGIDSVFLHDWNVEYSPNVVAVLPGIAHPERMVVIGGHYDSITANTSLAPGADDNASGTACVIECARIMSQYEFDCTIVFIAFSGEEQGLLGSEAFAAEAAARGDEIAAMIAVDMIGYVAPADAVDLDIIDNAYSAWLRDRVIQVGALYVPGFPIVHGSLTGGSSDHASFWRHGYDAIMFFEDSGQYSPYIHTVNDVIGVSYINHTLAEGSVKTAVALVADLAAPFRVAIVHTPLAHTADEINPYRVAARILSAEPLDPASLVVHYTTGSAWHALALSPAGNPDEFEAFIPAQAGGTVVGYYVVAEDVHGARAADPPSAPAQTHTFAVGTLEVVLEDDFEADRGWTVGASGDDATMGIWERADPNATHYSSTMVQPEDDHSPDPGAMCFVTGNSPPGAAQAANDVDDGRTTLLSPVIDLSGCTNAWASYHRWYTNDTGASPALDYWTVDVSPDSGGTWFRLETTNLSKRSWTRVEHNLLEYIPLTSGVRFRFVASDEEPGSIVEAALDDFAIVTYRSAPTSIEDVVPAALRLEQNVPNPFNPETTIRFDVPPPGAAVTLAIYDVSGRLVVRLLDNERVAGTRSLRWDGKDASGRDVASGVYFYRLEAGRESLSRKLVLLR